MTKRRRNTPPPAKFIDIHLECDVHQLALERDPAQAVGRLSYQAATETAETQGQTLAHPEPTEVHTTRATTPTGFDVILIASRWEITT